MPAKILPCRNFVADGKDTLGKIVFVASQVFKDLICKGQRSVFSHCEQNRTKGSFRRKQMMQYSHRIEQNDSHFLISVDVNGF